MLDLKIAGRTQLAGLNKMHGAVVELAGVTRFAQKPGSYVESSKQREVPMIALFEHFHFIGGAELTFANWKYVGDWWVDKISSILVVAGTWEFFSKRDYKGDCWTYAPGLYDEIGVSIASFRRVWTAQKQISSTNYFVV